MSLSVAYIGPKSRTERHRKTKIGTEVAHITRDLDSTFKVDCQGHQAALVGCTCGPTWTYSNGTYPLCVHDVYRVTTCRPVGCDCRLMSSGMGEWVMLHCGRSLNSVFILSALIAVWFVCQCWQDVADEPVCKQEIHESVQGDHRCRLPDQRDCH